MPQGKSKVKTKKPAGAKTKKRTIKKAKDVQKKNRPATPKKTAKVKDAVTKAINESNETAARDKAVSDGKSLSVLPTDDVGQGAADTKGKKGAGASKGKGKKGKK